MNPAQLLAHFDRIAEAPDAVPRLRRFILDLAVRGKLLPQSADDEAGSATVRIRKRFEEHSRSSRSRRNSTSLPLETVFPFALPANWEWRRLEEAAAKISDGEHLSPRKTKSGMPLLTAKHILEIGVSMVDPQYVTQEDGLRFRERCDPQLGDVLICSRGTIGRCCVVDTREIFCLMGSVILVRPHPELDSKYLSYFLKGADGQRFVRGVTKGMAVNALYLKDIKLCQIPLPPLAEQHRIVAKVDELMALCDELEAAQAKREQRRDRLVAATLHGLNNGDPSPAPGARFTFQHLPRLTTRPEHIRQLRQTILNLAVRGKLVRQDQKDQPASELIERIRIEKARETRHGKPRRNSPQPRIDEAHTPFALPFGWAWARFLELGVFGRGKSKHRPRNDPSLFEGGTHLFVQTGDVARSKGTIETFTGKYNEAGLAQSAKWPKGTLCITIAANIADSGILSFDACFPDSVVGFIPTPLFPNARYFDYFIRTAKAELLEFAPATAQKNINLGILNDVLIPLPPLAEQHRIVAKVDELMALCDALEAQLTTTATTSRRLLEATLHEALAD